MNDITPEMLARHTEETVFVRLPAAEIDRFNKIVEGYDNLALISTLAKGTESEPALLVCWVTPDTRPLLLKLLSKLKIEVIQAPI